MDLKGFGQGELLESTDLFTEFLVKRELTKNVQLFNVDFIMTTNKASCQQWL